MFPFPCETRGGGDKKVDTTVFMIIFSFFDPTIEKEGEREREGERELSILFLRERERDGTNYLGFFFNPTTSSPNSNHHDSLILLLSDQYP
jgi:hypothetical protein